MKKALITGTSRGIGKAIASRLLEEGWTVVGISRSPSEIGHPLYFHKEIDLKNKHLPQELKDLSRSHPRFDALICNAGMGVFGHLEEFSYQMIEEVMRLNFLSHVFLIKTFLPEMKKQRSGAILCIGSEAAIAGKRKGSIYCASKFALRGFTQALREECAADAIQVTLINPGMVNTSFFDALNFCPGREEEESIAPEDIAASVSMALNIRKGTVIDEINLSPQKRKVVFGNQRHS